ncbi:sigma-70 family RNA polymerase sigma factor [Lentzea sp. NPDC005914]|uniref:sigma-70 family RNA polymerase sigma factor n=1 Tax=Lentzea sp. NPDC005914 TaxID=3154572 RepID=UPI0033F9EECD
MISTGLVQGAAAGDQQATAELFAALRPVVLRYVRRRVQPDLVEDTTQDVCERLIAALPGYRSYGRPFLAFVYRVAANRIIDIHRAAARNPSILVDELPPSVDDQPGPEQLVIRADQATAAKAALDHLTADQRAVVVMRIFAEMSFTDIAVATDTTTGAVKALQHRALLRLRKTVQHVL